MTQVSVLFNALQASLSIEVSPFVPLDNYIIMDGVIYVHPDSKEKFMNLLRAEFPDVEGHKAFAV